MLKSILNYSLVFLLTLGSFTMVAQETAKKAEMKADKQVEMLDQKLDLSAKQATELKAIFAKSNNNLKTLNGKEKMRAQKEVNNDIEEVLNEKQLTEYHKMQKTMKRDTREKMKLKKAPQKKMKKAEAPERK